LQASPLLMLTLSTAVGLVTQRDANVGISQIAVLIGHEIFAGDSANDFKNAGVVNIPRAYLLLNHIETGLFEIHTFHHM
jgi:hypothetical protein